VSGPSTPRAVGTHSSQHGKRRSLEWRTTVDSAELLDRAITRRNDWLRWALCTLPADRSAAEAALTALYAQVGQDAPRFVWVESPRAAWAAASAEGLAGEPLRLRASSAPERAADWPLSGRLATLMSALRHRLDGRVRRRARWLSAWPSHPAMRTIRMFPPRESLSEGLGLEEVLRVTVRDTLRGSVHESLGGPLRTALAEQAGGAVGLTWYGQHDAHWVAEHDIRRDLGTVYRDEDSTQLDLWAVLARSCGWWWPYEQVCVVSERPRTVHTEPVPGAMHGELRLHSGKGQAVTYSDGWGLYSWHGTRVPSWVITDPSVEQIVAEINAEVRRCAIERIGWDVYIDQAGLNLLSVAPDPGNPGCELQLYDMPTQVWGAPARVLLAVNGSVERDGHRRRYGLSVPADLDDPVAAAGWSYGLTGGQYAQMLRRT
jgi:hypothetical protein